MSFLPIKRVLGGIGGLEVDSDEEIEIDESATLTLGGVDINYTEHVSKKKKRSHTSGTLFGADLQKPTEVQEPIEPQPSTKGKSRKQGASMTMAAFSSEFLVLQESILLKSYHRDVGSTCRCGKNPALFRCSGQEYCFSGRLYCGACIVQQHKWLPFHRIERWNGKTFVGHSLTELGYILYLGHCGEKCWNLSDRTPPRSMVIVHTNGYHRMLVHFCHCGDAGSEAIQVCDEQLFPATLIQPRTAFTFSLLDGCHIHMLSSKKPMGDFHDALVKMTNPSFPQDVPNRYVEMTHIYRVWIHLASVRRHGQTHGIDEILWGRRPNSLAYRCFACPEIGFNVDKRVVEDARESDKHKYTLFISIDGNFRLQRKRKKDDPDDFALNGGRAYFVENVKYRRYLEFIEDAKENCGCQHLRANRLQNMVKFKNAVVSGVVAIVCARHAFYLPQGMVDLTKGEGFANTDYALAYSLADAGHHRWIMVSYDIWCSFQANLKKRFAKFFPQAAAILERIRGAIPKMHIKNHLEACQLLWAFNYIYGSGETCGEQIETAWSEGNQAAASTKEMNEGHRHDILDEYHGYWNWTKTHKLTAAQYGAYTRCLDTLKKRETNFRYFEASMTKENVQKWQAMDDRPRMENKKVISVHTAKFKNSEGPPTQAKAYKSLLQQELENKLSVSSANKFEIGVTYFVNNGLRLERDQGKIAILSSIRNRAAAQTDLLLKMRIQLRQALIDWRKLQYEYCPFLKDRIDAVDPTSPELENLFLPSSFQQVSREMLGLTELAKLEYQLRLGQVHDALNEVRTKIKIFNANLDFKKKNVFGQQPNTRAQQYLQTLSADKINAADKYRQARQALLNLGLSENDQSLRPLHDHELWGKDTSRPARLGDTKREEPWFWTVGMPSGLSEADQTEWSIELDRVKYFRDRAARDRAKEEKELLEAEMDRIVSSFSRMKTAWLTMAKDIYRKPGCSCSNLDGNGCIHTRARSAYAFKQVEMYERFETDAEERRKNAKVKGDSFNLWLQSKDSHPHSQVAPK